MPSPPKPSGGENPSALILAVARDRDRESFAALFLHFAPRVKSYLLRLGLSASEAEELAQEALLIVWRKADHFNPDRANASTWIFTIARNLRVDAARRQRVAQAATKAQALEPRSDDEPSAADTMIAGEACRSVAAALQTLPADQADVVRLSFFEDRPHADIAAALGIPLGTVKSRLRLAMARLRAALEGEK